MHSSVTPKHQRTGTTAKLPQLDSYGLRAEQDLQIRRQILRRQPEVTLPKTSDSVRSFWITFCRTYAEAYGHAPRAVRFRQSNQLLCEYPPATAGTCVLFSGGVESTYVSLRYPEVTRFTIKSETDVHPRGGEMFIKARARGFKEVLYGGNEKNWGERDGCMWDPQSGKWMATEGFEFSEKFRLLWGEQLGLRVVCPTEHLYKDEIIQKTYSLSENAYYSLQSCDFQVRGWCGYCDKCLVTGAIIEALRLPRLFKMKPSIYSDEIQRGLKKYRTGEYDPFWKLPVFRRLQDVFGYTLRI